MTEEMTSHFCQANGINLHYLDHGGSGPTLVLAPGLTANAHSFDGLAAALGGAVRLIAVDLRGRGLSDKPDAGYSMEDHAADVMGLLDHLGITQANFGGHSYGGLLTYHLAAHHPERVRRCVVLDAPAEVNEGIMEQIKPSLDRLGKSVPSWDDYITAVKAQPYYEGWWDPQIETYYRADVEVQADGSVRSRSKPDHIRQVVEGTIGVPWVSYLERIEGPVLLFRATQPFGPPGSPPILDADQARSMLTRLRQARLVELEANHLTMLFGDSASKMAAEISEFLGED